MRKSIIIIVCGIAVLLLGYAGYRGYRVWKQNHWLTMAKEFAAKGDFTNESLSLQQVLSSNPKNVEACRMMAQLAELMHKPIALSLRQRVVDLQPQSLDDRLLLVQTALLFNDLLLASNTLADASEADRQTAKYQNIAGVVASAAGRNDEALDHLNEAIRIDPSNPVVQLNLAVVQLHGTNPLDQAEARIRLQRISLNTTDSNVRDRARRQIISDAMAHKDFKTALSVSKELASTTNAIFSDQLLRLGVLLDTKNKELASALSKVQQEAVSDPVSIQDLGNWMMTRIGMSNTLSWLQSLPPDLQTNAPVNILVAECFIGMRDWHRLQMVVQNQTWNDSEYARHAVLALAMREQGMTSSADAEWSAALLYAGSRKDGVDKQINAKLWLLDRAGEWKWTKEREDLLWSLVNDYPDLRLIPDILKSTLVAQGRTRSLMQLLGIMSRRAPNNLNLKNDLAMTAMLLNAAEVDSYGLAKEVYQADPKNSSYISTYAFSLFLQKKYQEALKIIQQIPSKQLSEPGVAGYYALILKANGDSMDAKKYFAIAAKAPLLPEEKKLFESAQN